VNDYRGIYGWPDSDFNLFLAEVERAGIIRITETVFFRHRSFLDYFAALRVMEHPEEHTNIDADIVAIYFDDIWTDVAFYYVGMRRELTQAIINGIAEFPEKGLDTQVSKMLIGRLLQAGWYTPTKRKIEAIRFGLQQVPSIRSKVDSLIDSYDKPIPKIFSDIFLMTIAHYSFGSKTMLNEVSRMCEELCISGDIDSFWSCMLLLWANRIRIPRDVLHKHVSDALRLLSELEKENKLTVRDSFMALFVLKQVEREDKNLMRSIERKIKRTMLLYPNEIKQLLPWTKSGLPWTKPGLRDKRN
jgi:hypothetical protein